MRSFARELRVADHLRERLAELIRGELRDPRIGMVSVNDVRVSRDLSTAEVYVSALDCRTPEDQRGLEDALNHAAGFLRTQIARSSTMRTTPKLRFHFDEVWARGARVDALIDQALEADRKHPDASSHAADASPHTEETP
jgi:ribosome-binding factor A